MRNTGYIEELQSAVEDKEKIGMILRNIVGLKEYLIQIGVKPEMTEKAGFIFLVQEEMRNLLLKDSVQVTKKGIVAPDRSMLAATKKNGIKVLQYSPYDDEVIRNVYAEQVKDSDEILFVQETPIIKIFTNINSQGIVDKEIKFGKTSLEQSYIEMARMSENGIPVIMTNIVNGSYFNSYRKDIDFGNPFFIPSTSDEFFENYETYVKDFPELEGWYDERFSGFKDDIDMYSNKLRDEQLLLEIKELEEKINASYNLLHKKKLDVQRFRVKLEQMIGFLNDSGKKNPLIKPSIDSIFSKIQEMNDGKIIPEPKEPIVEEKKENEEESLLNKKKRLSAKLTRIQSEIVCMDKYLPKLRTTADTIGINVSMIPIVGKRLIKKANEVSVVSILEETKKNEIKDEPSL